MVVTHLLVKFDRFLSLDACALKVWSNVKRYMFLGGIYSFEKSSNIEFKVVKQTDSFKDTYCHG